MFYIPHTNGEVTGGLAGATVRVGGHAGERRVYTGSDMSGPVRTCSACRRRAMGLLGGSAHTCGIAIPVLTCNACHRRSMGLSGGRAHSCV